MTFLENKKFYKLIVGSICGMLILGSFLGFRGLERGEIYGIYSKNLRCSDLTDTSPITPRTLTQILNSRVFQTKFANNQSDAALVGSTWYDLGQQRYTGQHVIQYQPADLDKITAKAFVEAASLRVFDHFVEICSFHGGTAEVSADTAYEVLGFGSGEMYDHVSRAVLLNLIFLIGIFLGDIRRRFDQ